MIRPLIIATALGLACSPVQAGFITHTGVTTSDPTYNRLQVPDPSNPTVLTPNTAGANADHYDAYTFSVNVSGQYSFLTATTFSGYQFLYAPFTPTVPTAGAVIGNQELSFGVGNGFQQTLTAGTAYTLVTTGFFNTSTGFFSATIGGPGAIAPITIASSPTTASVLTFTGNTTTGSTFDRAAAGDPNDPNSPITVSTAGGGERYDAHRFSVAVTGDYLFTTTGDYDTYSFLYGGTFDPTHALVNALRGSDDYFDPVALTDEGPYVSGTSAFLYHLVAGNAYTFVTTGYDATTFGAFTDTISGPGAILPAAVALLPEPDETALLLIGAFALAFVARRSLVASRPMPRRTSAPQGC